MNWGEGLNRVVRVLGGIYIGSSALLASYIWYEAMRTYRYGQGYLWEWDKFSDAFREACTVIAWAFVWYLVGVGVVRAVRWIAKGFRQPA